MTVHCQKEKKLTKLYEIVHYKGHPFSLTSKNILLASINQLP